MRNRHKILLPLITVIILSYDMYGCDFVHTNIAMSTTYWAQYDNVPHELKQSTFPYLDYFNFDRSYNLILSLLFAIIYSILTMLIILPFILFNRNKMEKKAVTDQYLKEKFQELLIAFLYNDPVKKQEVKEKIKNITKSNYSSQFLINEIIDLSINLKGDTTNELRKLYLELELDKLTFKKVKSRKWHIKIKAFRELAFMNLKTANNEILKSLESKNDILRMEAQIALVRLNEKDPFRFLDKLEKPFTLWEQMNIHELLILHNLVVPEFRQWVKSGNKSIAIFAISMVRIFKQNEALNEIIELLDHDDIEIREAAIKTIGSLKTKKGLLPLKKYFKTETYDNKINILKAFQKNTDTGNIEYLKKILETEDDVNIQVEAAKGIRDIGKPGQEELERLIASDEYRNYFIVLRHVLDKRI